MATTVARLQAVLGADTRDFDRAMNRSDRQAETFGSRLGHLTKTAGLVAGAAGLGAIAYTLKTGIREWKQQQIVAAQTNAVLKSTRHGAHITSDEIDRLASSLMKKSGVDDEAIKSSENLLLTFRNIRNETGKGNDMFNQATKATLDLSVAFHKDLNSSAILVGKALNDPIKGLTALQRVGVTFTQGQRDQIKALVASGHAMQAQKLIMSELHAETAGSAEAYGKTLPGMISIARESFNNWAGDLVTKMIPALTRTGNWVREHWPEIKNIIVNAWAAIRPVLAAMITLFVSIVTTIRQHWGTIGPIVRAVVTVIRDQLAIVAGIIKFFAAVLRGDWSQAWNQLRGIVANALRLVRDVLIVWKDIIFAAASAIARAVWSGFTGALEAGWKAVKNAISGLFGRVIDWVKNVLGVKSPSTVFHGIGQNVVRGFVGGVGSMAGVLKKAVIQMAKDALTGLGGRIFGGGGLDPGSPEGIVAMARMMAFRRYRWAQREWVALYQLWNKESGFDPHAMNQASGAYGIPQALPYTKMPRAAWPESAGGHSDAAAQIGWGLNYIKERYGSPLAAWAHSERFNWYDKGGWLPPGLSLALNQTGRPERVLPPNASGGTTVIPVSIGGEHIATIIFDEIRRKAKIYERRNGQAAFGGA